MEDNSLLNHDSYIAKFVHNTCREATIILEDVAVQLGLSINREAVTGLTKVLDLWGTCSRLLGRVPFDDEGGKLTELKFTWLRANFKHLPNNPMQMDIIYAARAFILQLIGGILLPDVNQNKDIFGDDPEPKYLTPCRSSLYHPELHRQSLTPHIEDIFGSAPPVFQYPNTSNDGEYDYTSFFNTPEGTPKVGPSNYQTP
ncbi:hypothetical protein J1N35_025216 [Gossypium stocksii]|uniref:Aminotransferase-like plant mobile domain-containing protein n=1 Tax=Gossypium stocksii TaxID=47602 RepID=A0A9D3ZY22_9ROSI|nr:hypothetical protein J1N35_025216 [Gossypium stocksii]